MYGSETWAMKTDDMQRLERTQRMMIRCMCGVKLSDRTANVESAGHGEKKITLNDYDDDDLMTVYINTI